MFLFFPSPAAKMPRTSASGDDTAVGQTIPSTIVDLLKGNGTTLPTSSSNVDKADDAGKQTLVVKSARKFGIKGLALRRAPT